VTVIDPPEGLEGVAVIPPDGVSTIEARAALPEQVALADATFNVARASQLTLGLARGDLATIGLGLEDRLHQPHRRHLYPRSMELVDRARELGALGATISGAGPTVLFWVFFEQTGALIDRLREEVGDWAEVRRLNFVAHGADVESL
jgi:homoserine kinase